MLNPPPSTKTESYQRINEEIATRMMNGDENAKEELIINNLKLAQKTAYKLQNEIFDFDDTYSIALIGLMKAADSFDPDKKIKFASFATTVMTNEIYMQNRSNKYLAINTSLHQVLNTDADGNTLTMEDVLEKDLPDHSQFLENEELNEFVKGFIDRLEGKHKIVFYELVIKGNEQKIVGEITNLSQSYISRLYRNLITKLRKELIAWGYAEKDEVPKEVVAVSKYCNSRNKNKKVKGQKMINSSYRMVKYSAIKYVFENYTELSNKQISIASNLLITSVNKAKYDFNVGRFDEIESTTDYKNDIENYIKHNKDVIYSSPVKVSSIYDLPPEERAKYI